MITSTSIDRWVVPPTRTRQIPCPIPLRQPPLSRNSQSQPPRFAAARHPRRPAGPRAPFPCPPRACSPTEDGLVLGDAQAPARSADGPAFANAATDGSSCGVRRPPAPYTGVHSLVTLVCLPPRRADGGTPPWDRPAHGAQRAPSDLWYDWLSLCVEVGRHAERPMASRAGTPVRPRSAP